jgi:hypothetical protein
MRRSKRDSDKPIPRSDLDKVATLRAELEVFGKLVEGGTPRKEAIRMVWQDDEGRKNGGDS